MSAAGDFAGWIGDLEAAVDEVARSALGAEPLVTSGTGVAPPSTWHGAYVGLVGAAGAVQIGVAADLGGCQKLSKRLLGMDEGEPDLPTAEVADAVCEIVNIVAGVFKGRLRERVGQLQLGLPVFFEGPALPTEHTAVVATAVRVCDVPAAAVLVHPRAAGAR